MPALQFHQFVYGSDNYGVLVHDPETGKTACVDAGDATAVLAALDQTGWNLSDLWITHHHWDHTDGLAEVKSKTRCEVRGPKPVSKAVEGLDHAFEDGNNFDFAGHRVEVIHTPGHTTDMINFYLPEDGVVFTGDTLFVLGCGRVFEGTPEMMWTSLQKLMALPDDTVIYCSHEYTKANADFAITIEPENEKLVQRREEIIALREKGEPTVPTTLSIEKATNPFLRASSTQIRKNLGMAAATDAEVFAEIRGRKDRA